MMKHRCFAGRNRPQKWFVISWGLKVMIAIGLGISMRASNGLPRDVLAQTGPAPFPGTLVSEGRLADVSPDYELIYLGHHRILGWAGTSNQYHIWRYDPALAGGVGTFPGQLLTEGAWSAAGPGRRLTYLGDARILDWQPRTGQYRVQQYHLDTGRSANLLATQAIVTGSLGNPTLNAH
jgi:hypothetical protein